MANPFLDTIKKGVGGMFGGSAPAITTGGNGAIDQMIAGLGKGVSPASSGWADLGSALGSFSQGRKADRIVEGQFQGDFDQMMLNREAAMNRTGLEAQVGRNQNEEDAMRKLQQTSYLMGGGSNFQTPQIQLGGQTRQLPSYWGISPQQPSAAEKQGAASLQQQVLGRLQPGGSFEPQWNYQPKPVEEYSKPGIMEQIGSYGGAASGIMGALDKSGGISKMLGGMGGKIGSAVGGGLAKAGGAIGGMMGLGGAGGGALAGGAIPGFASAGMLAPGATSAAAGTGAAGGGLGMGFLANPAFWTNPWTIGIAGGALAAKPIMNKLRGGEEGMFVNPARDQYFDQFETPDGLNLPHLMSTLTGQSGGGPLIDNLFKADSKDEYANATSAINQMLASRGLLDQSGKFAGWDKVRG